MDSKVAAVENLLIQECMLAADWSSEQWQDLVDKVLTRFSSDSGPHTLRGKLAYAIAIIGSENREFFYLAFKDLCDWSPIGGPYWVLQEETLRHHILFFIAKGILPVSMDFDNGDDTSAEDTVDLDEAKKVIQKILSDVKIASITHKILRERLKELRTEFLKLLDALESVTSIKEAHNLLYQVEEKFPLKHFVDFFLEWAQSILISTEPLQNQYVHKIVASPISCRPTTRAIARANASSSIAQQTKIVPSSPITQDLPEDGTSVEEDAIDDKATDDLRREGDSSPYHGGDDRGDTMDDFGEQPPILSDRERESVDATSPPIAAATTTAAVTRMRGTKRSFERVDYPELGTHPDEQHKRSQPQPQPQQQEKEKQQAQDRAMIQILSEVMYLPPASSPGDAPAVSQPSFASPSAATTTAAAATAATATAATAAVPVDPSTQLETDKDETECGSELTSSPSTKSSTSMIQVRYYVSPRDLNGGAPEEGDDGGVRERENGGILTPWKTICRLFTN